MLDTLDAQAVRRWCASGLEAMRRHQREIDDLNVYPVPDGDTGTNLVLTLTSAYQAVSLDLERATQDGGAEHGRALRRMARGALLGARGNSGVILSQLLKGLAETLAGAGRAGGHEMAAALRASADAAYKAVATPVEGTILTVAAAAAQGAAAACQRMPGSAGAGSPDGAAGSPAEETRSAPVDRTSGGLAAPDGVDVPELGAVVRAAADAAAEALARTPQQLPALARAGVVDAGGRGLLVLLDALVEVVTGRPPRRRASGDARPSRPSTVAAAATAPPARARTGLSLYGYEVQYLLDAAAEDVERLRDTLGDLGDSLVIVDTGPAERGGQSWHVHVHVNDVGAALEAGVIAGRPHQISVTHFADQVAEHGSAGAPAAPGTDAWGAATADGASPAGSGAAPSPAPGAARSPVPGAGAAVEPVPGGPDTTELRGVVVAAPGGGLAALLTSEGAMVVGGNPSTAEILDAIRRTGADRVVVFPDNPNTRAVATAAATVAGAEGRQVRVVSSRSPVQALAALAIRDPARRFDDDVIAMAEAAAACRTAEVCMATREALTSAGPCRPGDVLAMVDGDVNQVGSDLLAVSRDLLDRMLGGGGELVTLVTGADAPPGLVEALRAHLVRRWPFVEVNVHDGGQPHYPLLVGVE